MKFPYVFLLIVSYFLLTIYGKSGYFRVKKSIENQVNKDVLKCKNVITCKSASSNEEQFLGRGIIKIKLSKRESAVKEKKKKMKVVPSTLKFTPEKCNNPELQSIMIDNIVADEPNESKKRIHKVTNEILSPKDDKYAHYDVICSSAPFSFRIATQVFCEMTIKKVTCFAYRQIGFQKVQ
uniref:Ground-like domain-containing protein n=1 Tax=Strongyloides venezuelensis TaxID=75913 RepID=A0A0K0FF95_STRVS